MTVRAVPLRPGVIAAIVFLLAVIGFPPPVFVPRAGAISPEEAAAQQLVPNPAPSAIRISLTSITPEVLDRSAVGGTIAGVPTVTVAGTVRNVSDQPVTDVEVRLQRGPRLDSDDIRQPLVWAESDYQLAGPFQTVTDSLAPGAELAFQLSMPALPVPGGPSDTPDLQLSEPGVYPLLVNVNGNPDGSGTARLDDARTLLPVLTVPQPSADSESTSPGDAATPSTALPTLHSPALPLTVIVPIAATPDRLAHIPGVDGPETVVVLADGQLVRDLSTQGRLTGLLTAADTAFQTDGGQQLREASCFGVDPDLVDTLDAIAAGQPVVIDSGESVPHTLAQDARNWLDLLRSTVADGCVFALPAAQADLDAVAAVDDARLASAALDEPGTLSRILGRPVLSDVLMPTTGTMLSGTAPQLGVDSGSLILAANSTRTDTGLIPAPGVVNLDDQPGLRAVTYDPVVGQSLAATGSFPETPRYADPATRYWLTADSEAARLQDARAALLAPLIDNRRSVPTDDAATAASNHGVFVVPPAVWSVGADAATSLLTQLAHYLDSGAFRAQPLPDRLAGPTTVPSGTLAIDPVGAADPGALTGPTIDAVRRAMGGVHTLHTVVDTSDPASQGAWGHLAPLTGDALRALSTTGHRFGGDGVTLESETGLAARSRTDQRITHLQRTVRAALKRIDLLPPGSVFTMASPNSPLLLVARNGLPFPVSVSVNIDAPPGLMVEAVDTVSVPAAGSRTLQLPTEASAEVTGRQTVTLTLLDTAGNPISESVELEVQTGRYPLAVVFTVAAGALALILAARRYLRYRRGTPDPEDEGHRP